MKNFLLFGLLFLFTCQSTPTKDTSSDTESTPNEWVSLFNGKDLSGWTPKINGFPLGENYGNTFRVENGAIQVNYDQYEEFGKKYGHLFYKSAYRNYHLKLQYRFTGPQAPGGEGWAFKNSGVMFHCQAPKTMHVDQGFPVSLEAQMLGGKGEGNRPTGNLCTPGYHVIMGDTLVTKHCITANAPTFHDDQWIDFELRVYNDSLVQHFINGQVVIAYSRPTVGGEYLPEQYPIKTGTAVKEGYIALQSESHPIEFREIYVKELEGE